MKLHALALAAGLMVSGTASAVVTLNLTGSTNLGNFDAPKSWSESFQVSQPGTINHSLAFTITEDLYAGSGLANIPLSWDFGNFTVQFTNINGLAASIVDGNNTPYVSFTQVSPGYLTLPASTYFATGTYTLKVTGTANGSGNPAGMYTIAAVTAPVPEPGAWGMLLAGLGLIGLRLRQRMRTPEQAIAA